MGKLIKTCFILVGVAATTYFVYSCIKEYLGFKELSLTDPLNDLFEENE